MDYINTQPQLRSFLIYLRTIKGKSEKTIFEYFLDIQMLLRFLKKLNGLVDDSISFNEIIIDDIPLQIIEKTTLEDLYLFMNYLQNTRKNSNRTRARKTASIRSFYKYLTVTAKLFDNNPAKHLELPKVKKNEQPKYLSLDQSKKLLTEVDGNNKKRDYAILTLFLNCGMRLSELVGIEISDIKDTEINEPKLRVVGKGNKERTIYLNKACSEAVFDYLYNERPISNSPALFLNNRKKPMSNQTVHLMVKKYLAKAGIDIKVYSTHKLRHTAATLMYQYGDVDIRALQEILGHENLSTTEIYTHVDDERLRKAANKNPLAEFSPPHFKKDKT